MTDQSENTVVLYERRGALAWITLNRPEALSAINEPMRELFADAVARDFFAQHVPT